MKADRPNGERKKPGSPSAHVQFTGFLNKFAPATVADARAALQRMRRLVPGAVELVYDNYNALVVGFGPNERASDAVMSLAIFPRWVTLCFIQNGPDVADPQHLLKGSGNVVRHVRLQSAKDLDVPAIRALIKSALSLADVPIDSKASRRMVIKSVSAKQRPRRTDNHVTRRR
jgi:hypothetical protein